MLDGPLSRQVKASEALWVIETSQASRQPVASLAAAAADTGTQLHVMLPKRDRHYWRSVFEGGLEKSHVEVSKGRQPWEQSLAFRSEIGCSHCHMHARSR